MSLNPDSPSSADLSDQWSIYLMLRLYLLGKLGKNAEISASTVRKETVDKRWSIPLIWEGVSDVGVPNEKRKFLQTLVMTFQKQRL